MVVEPERRPSPSLDEWMTANRWTISAMARELDVDISHLRRIRIRHAEPSLPLAVKIENFTGGAVPATSLVLQPHEKAPAPVAG